VRTPLGHVGECKLLLYPRDTPDTLPPRSLSSGITGGREFDGCAICQQHKINRHPICPPLQPISPEKQRPFSLITMDFITDLPPSDGYDSIMAVVDQGSSKGAIFMPCNKTIDATGTATLLLDSLYRRYGLPDKAISDRGPQFASHVF